MRLDHLLSREEEVRVLYTVEFSRGKKRRGRKRRAIKPGSGKNLKNRKRIPVVMRLGDTPVPIPNTMVKTQAADDTMLETAWKSRWLPDPYKKKPLTRVFYIERTYLNGRS